MRKLKTILILSLSLLLLFKISAFSNPNPEKMKLFTDKKYKEEWAKVDSLQNEGLPKSALEVVTKIYQKAKADKNYDQIIKAFVYRLKFKNQIEQDAFVQLIQELEGEVIISPFPANAIMHSMLSEMYWWYYQNNRYKFMNRSETVDFDNYDMRTWGLNKLADVVIKHYKQSLENAGELQKLPLKTFNEIINWGSHPKDLRPTLYDFLAHRAIDNFMNTELSVTHPADKFELKEDYYFADAGEFVKQQINTVDTLSQQFHTVTLLQDLIRFRLTDNKIDALIDADLKRIDYAYKTSVNPNKDSLYFGLLERLEKKYEKEPFSAEISFRLATYYVSRALRYKAFNEDTKQYKYDKKKALEIIHRVVKQFPKSTGASRCLQLEISILQKTLSFQSEKTIAANYKWHILANYHNIEKMYVRVALISEEKAQKIYEKYYDGKYVNDRDKKYFDELKATSQELEVKTIELPKDDDLNNHSLEAVMKEQSYGYYLVMVANNDKFTYEKNLVSYSFMRVSDISYVQREREDGSREVFVMSRRTGKSVSDVNIQTWYNKWNSKSYKYKKVMHKKYTTNQEGYFKIDAKKNDDSKSLIVEFRKDSDYYSTDNSFYLRYKEDTPVTRYTTTIFTDRAIYRPGQTIHFKGIVLQNIDGEDHKIVPKYKIGVIMYDVNHQKVHDVEMTTNDYGTFSGSFTIPTGLLNGRMQIYTYYGSKEFYVEEYKRPKFETKILPIEGSFLLNDSVTVTGLAKAFAGSNVTVAPVKYRVIRKPIWRGWWSYYFNANPVEIANGETVTDEKGEFKINFLALPDLSLGRNDNLVFSYQIIADVTDINGETQSTTKSMVVGYKALHVDVKIPSEVDKNISDKEGVSYKLVTENLNGEFVATKGKIQIYNLKEPTAAMRNRNWSQPDKQIYSKEEWEKLFPGNVYKDENNIVNLEKDKVIFEEDFDTKANKKLQIKSMKKWKTGRYVAEITATDAFGNPVLNKKYFAVYSSADKKMPYKAIDWFSVINANCEPGENAEFLIGTAKEDIMVLYEVEHRDSIIHKEWIKLSNEQKKITIPVKEEYRGNFVAHFLFLDDNRQYQHDAVIMVPYTNKELDIEFATFRDKLYPGQDEEWRIKIKGSKGEKVAAEMLATLYDASLDKFRKNSWYFDIYRSYYAHLSWNSQAYGLTSSKLLKYDVDKFHYFSAKSYDSFNWFGFTYYDYSFYSSVQMSAMDDGLMVKTSKPRRAMALKKKSKEMAKGDFAVEGIEMEADLEITDEEAKSPSPIDEKDKNILGGKDADNGLEEVKVRTNFNETAFFYPQLETNEEGEVIVKFTIPESLTKWKMLGFAHTKDLKFGLIDNELVTQKDLMVLPNPPRFFRENDKIEFTAKISNISEEDLEGIVRLELFDAITMKPLEMSSLKKTATQNFAVKSQLNTSASWILEIPEGVGAITYRIVAKAGNFSDGEEMAIPVLTNRMLVTESLPLPMSHKGTKEFEFTKLLNSGKSKTLRHHKLTLEFTSNAAWYAVQALPYLMEYPYECSEQTFSRYYANSLASHIANSSPKIKRVFDSWKNTPGSEALLSNLEKNQDLKALMLEETPWVLNSQNETERKRRVGLLFDLNKMSDELGRAIKKLQKDQAGNGGWPWFTGMPESWYITQHIVCGMGHLDHLGVKTVREDTKVWNMLTKAVDYLDNRLKKEYNAQKKYCKEECENDKDKKCYEKCMERHHLSGMIVHYMYARSYFMDLPIPKGTQEAFDYYKGQAIKYWLKHGKYQQGMIALGLKRFGETKVPAKIVKSLDEHSMTSEELGMYWDDNVSGYYWYQAPIETQALMIEVFDEVADDQDAVNNLKIWLLKQKQTQDWKTTKATVEAVYALLLRGGDWLASDEMVKIKLGDMDVDPKKMDDVKVEAGTGYFKTSWKGSEIKPKMGKVTLIKNDEGVSWGALYWQYFEDLDKITPHETPLKLNKKLFVEQITDRGPVIVPLEDDAIVNIGDKIVVRIELRVDRAMEYIHMKDMRASGFEPINVISQYKWQDGLGYYESTKDAATNFFIGWLPKGTYVFEYPLRVSHNGDFSNGVTTIQCMYAPEFTSHSEGVRVKVEKK